MNRGAMVIGIIVLTTAPIRRSLAADAEPSEESARSVTLEEVRGTFPTLVANYVRHSGGPGGAFVLKDSRAAKWLTVRVVRVESASVVPIGENLYSGNVVLSDPGGRRLHAQAIADLSEAEWRISKFELTTQRKAAAPKDAGRIFGAVVLEHIQSVVKRYGVFSVANEISQRKHRLKLRTIPADAIVSLGAGRYRSPVYFTDIEDGSSVIVDFFVILDGESGHVDKTALHQDADP